MNVAFPAIFLFLLLSPGIVFYFLYQPREVRAADMSPFGTAVLTAAFAALLSNVAVTGIAVYCFGYAFHLGEVVRLLLDARTSSADSALGPVFSRLDEHPDEPVFFFLLTNLLAAVVAALWRFAVWRLGLDRPSFRFYRFVRPPAPWHYLFQGTDVTSQSPDAVVISALVPLKEATYLYTGLLEDYELTESGELQRLVLSNAARRPLERDRPDGAEPSPVYDATRFYPIEGNYFVLRASEFTTLNIKFLVLEEEAAASPGPADSLVAERDEEAGPPASPR